MGNDGWGNGGDPFANSNSDSDSGSGSGSGSLSGAGAGALGLAGAGAGAGALSGSDSGSNAGSGADSTSSSGSDSLNGNGNFNGNLDGNLNGNANLNGNENINKTSVDDTVKVTVTADVTDNSGPPTEYQNGNTGSFDTTNTTYNVPINLTDSPLNLAPANNFLAGGGDTFGFTGNGTDTAFHVDQVNGLIASNSLSDVSLTNNGDGFSQTADGVSGGSSTAGGIDHTVGDSVSSAVSSAANATASLSAFTQNIVLGANIQYNSLTQTNTGGDITHTASASDPVSSQTTLDPTHGGSGGSPMGSWHHG